MVLIRTEESIPAVRSLVIEEVHYTRRIIECRGCHLDFEPYGYAKHVLTCVPFRRTSSWTPNIEIIVPPPRVEDLLMRQQLIMAKHQSKYRVLSKRSHPGNIDLPMSGTESFIKVFLASGNNWTFKYVPIVADKNAFLSKVKEAFGVTSNDADLLD
uniref:Uncharacterized protein n=1 Tax=Tetranychus urticae TaxID=32264 RepID=T1L2Q4_TETUR